jgi:hypothetical protein
MKASAPVPWTPLLCMAPLQARSTPFCGAEHYEDRPA